MFRRRRPRLREAAPMPPPVSAPPQQPPVAGGLSHEAVEQLQSLAQLHDQGILTDQEFEQQKAKILGA
jgi:putative oligomerization/nucleic acid binding protein